MAWLMICLQNGVNKSMARVTEGSDGRILPPTANRSSAVVFFDWKGGGKAKKGKDKKKKNAATEETKWGHWFCAVTGEGARGAWKVMDTDEAQVSVTIASSWRVLTWI